MPDWFDLLCVSIFSYTISKLLACLSEICNKKALSIALQLLAYPFLFVGFFGFITAGAVDALQNHFEDKRSDEIIKYRVRIAEAKHDTKINQAKLAASFGDCQAQCFLNEREEELQRISARLNSLGYTREAMKNHRENSPFSSLLDTLEHRYEIEDLLKRQSNCFQNGYEYCDHPFDYEKWVKTFNMVEYYKGQHQLSK